MTRSSGCSSRACATTRSSCSTRAGTCASWNAGAERIKGYTADEIIGQHFSSSTRRRTRGRQARAGARGGARATDASRITAGACARTAPSSGRTSSSRRCTRTAAHVGFAKITRDLTDRDVPLVRRGDARDRVDGGCTRARERGLAERGARSPGRPRSEWLGLRGWDPVHPDDLPAHARRVAERRSQSRPFEAEFRLRRHDGVYVWMDARAVPLFDA